MINVKTSRKSTRNLSKKGNKEAQKGKRESRILQSKSTTSAQQTVPVAFSNKRTTGKPETKHLPNGDVLIEHTEFVTDINGSTLFSTINIPVNPGQSQSFPWLSQIAPNYESYRFEVLEFEYQTACGSTTIGTVMLGVDYDASDPPPTDKIQFASYQGYCREAPWRSLKQFNTKQNLAKRSSYFVRSGQLSANQDIKLYDIGNLFVGTQGMSDTSFIGELYVRYRVRFMTPQMQNPAVGNSKSAAVTYSGSSTITVANGSNAPIAFTGTRAAAVMTALTDYDFLIVSNASSNGVAPTLDTTGSTGTIQNLTIAQPVVNPVVANSALLSAQVSLKTGQTLVINNSASALGNVIYLGQFNSTVL